MLIFDIHKPKFVTFGLREGFPIRMIILLAAVHVIIQPAGSGVTVGQRTHKNPIPPECFCKFDIHISSSNCTKKQPLPSKSMGARVLVLHLCSSGVIVGGGTVFMKESYG